MDWMEINQNPESGSEDKARIGIKNNENKRNELSVK